MTQTTRQWIAVAAGIVSLTACISIAVSSGLQRTPPLTRQRRSNFASRHPSHRA